MAPESLFLFRYQNEKANWSEVKTVGEKPARRYGHTITFSAPYVILFGGITGSETVNDSWCLNIDKEPFQWARLVCKGEVPSPRVYHSAAHCQSGAATGMIVIFGGRSGDRQDALNDAWGLRKHRDGRWDWVKAPYHHNGIQPKARYQHSGLFLGSLMFIIGGRASEMPDNLRLDIFDTETSEWHSVPNIQRFRHVAWLYQSSIFIQGGFEQENPSLPVSDVHSIDLFKALSTQPAIITKIKKFIQSFGSPHPSKHTSPALTPDMSPKGRNGNSSYKRPMNTSHSNTKDSYSYGNYGNKGMMEEEDMEIVVNMPSSKGGMKIESGHALAYEFLCELLKPKDYMNLPEDSKFIFPPEKIIKLCDQAEEIIKNQSMVLRFDSPVKIFGDIHGQYADLMRFFDLWEAPFDSYNNCDGDIVCFDYLFLGDFVDRGNHSLETICLLLALKVKYPNQIHLIRGNHEDKWINNGFGFSEECAMRLDEDPGDMDSVFNRINCLFEYLPLAAVVDDKILCLHGGIGATLRNIEQIEQLERPLEVVHEVQTEKERLVVDILWSDPTDSDKELGIQLNTIRDPQGTGNIVKFGPDVVKEFLKNNGLLKIIRAHECVMDGMERFAGGDLITVFSATDYCGRHKNAGAVLYLKKNFEITPKLIYPQNLGQSNWIEDEEALAMRPPTPPRWKERYNNEF